MGTALFLVYLGYLVDRLGALRRLGRALVGGGRPRRRPRAAARLGANCGAVRDDGLERLLPDDADVLLLRLRDADRGRAGGLRAALKIVVLTTSYPRDDDDPSGRFVADAVERLRERGVAIDVVSPAVFGSFGLAEAGGIPNNLRRKPWAAPLLVAAMTRAVRRAARDAELVPCALASVRGRRRLLGEAVRGHAAWDRRRSRPACPAAGAGSASPSPGGDRGLRVARRGGARAGRRRARA